MAIVSVARVLVDLNQSFGVQGKRFCKAGSKCNVESRRTETESSFAVASKFEKSRCTRHTFDVRFALVSRSYQSSILFLSILRCHFVSPRWKSLFSNFALQHFRVPLPLSLSFSLSLFLFLSRLPILLLSFRSFCQRTGWFQQLRQAISIFPFQLTWETNRRYFFTCTNCGNFI